jgi:acetyltransferase-like isoleucine patch superfamily enzyme
MQVKPVWRIIYHYLLTIVARVAPSLRLRATALRFMGVSLGNEVSWGLEATPDIFWPEYLEIGDHVIIGYDAVLLCHEFLQDEYRVGKITIDEQAMIGAKAVVLPGVHIGAGAQVAANSLVTQDVPSGVTVAGIPAKPITD